MQLDTAAYGRALFPEGHHRRTSAREGVGALMAFNDVLSWGPVALLAGVTAGPLPIALRRALVLGGFTTILGAGLRLKGAIR